MKRLYFLLTVIFTLFFSLPNVYSQYSNSIIVAGGNGQGSAANQLNSPYGVFVDLNKNIYVGDNGNNRVQKWALGASQGTTIAGGNGTGGGQTK